MSGPATIAVASLGGKRLFVKDLSRMRNALLFTSN